MFLASQWKIADYVIGNKQQPLMIDIDEGDDKSNLQERDNLQDETARLTWYDCFETATASKMEHAVASMWPVAGSSEIWYRWNGACAFGRRKNTTVAGSLSPCCERTSKNNVH